MSHQSSSPLPRPAQSHRQNYDVHQRTVFSPPHVSRGLSVMPPPQMICYVRSEEVNAKAPRWRLAGALNVALAWP